MDLENWFCIGILVYFIYYGFVLVDDYQEKIRKQNK